MVGDGILMAGCARPLPPDMTPIVPVSIEVSTPDSLLPFADSDANEVAKRVGIHAGDFFLFRKEVLDRLTAFRDQNLYPIYPPSVIQHRDFIRAVSTAYALPANVVGGLVTIESIGKTDAVSGAGAVGLFQPMPDKFPDHIRAIADSDKRLAAMIDPDTNARAGIPYFLEGMRQSRISLWETHHKDHANVYARALTGYNGGHGTIEQNFADFWDETKYYGDHIIRYFMTAQIAAGLSEKGFSDREIVEKLDSPEIKRRMYALRAFTIGRDGKYAYDLYTMALGELSLEVPGSGYPYTEDQLAAFAKAGYSQDFLKTIQEEVGNDYAYFPKAKADGILHPFYALPLSPGIAIWLATTRDESLFRHYSGNMDANAWMSMDTGRR